ncbi:hypothetical protein VPHD479_0033 [Vibrio phage D479]
MTPTLNLNNLNIGRNAVALNEVIVNRDKLLETVKANAEQHDVIYAEAMEAWREKSITFHRKQAAFIKKHGRENELLQRPTHPQSNAAEYKRAIRMIEMSTMDELQLTAQQFNQLVMDEWNWSHAFRSMATDLTGKLY